MIRRRRSSTHPSDCQAWVAAPAAAVEEELGTRSLSTKPAVRRAEEQVRNGC